MFSVMFLLEKFMLLLEPLGDYTSKLMVIPFQFLYEFHKKEGSSG